MYSIDEVPEISRSAMKSLFRLAVTNAHFKFNKISDGLAIGASLAVILAKLWMKSFEISLQKPDKGRTKPLPGREYALIVTDALLSEGKDSSANHAKTGIMQNAKLSMTNCAGKGTTEDTHEVKLFKRYVDHIVCTVNGNSLDYVEHANSLNNNLQFTLEKPIVGTWHS